MRCPAQRRIVLPVPVVMQAGFELVPLAGQAGVERGGAGDRVHAAHSDLPAFGRTAATPHSRQSLSQRPSCATGGSGGRRAPSTIAVTVRRCPTPPRAAGRSGRGSLSWARFPSPAARCTPASCRPSPRQSLCHQDQAAIRPKPTHSVQRGGPKVR